MPLGVFGSDVVLSGGVPVTYLLLYLQHRPCHRSTWQGQYHPQERPCGNATAQFEVMQTAAAKLPRVHLLCELPRRGIALCGFYHDSGTKAVDSVESDQDLVQSPGAEAQAAGTATGEWCDGGEVMAPPTLRLGSSNPG